MKLTKKKLLPNLKQVSASIKSEFANSPNFEQFHIQLSRATEIELLTLVENHDKFVQKVCSKLEEEPTLLASLGEQWTKFMTKKIETEKERYKYMQEFYLPTYEEAPRTVEISSNPHFGKQREEVLNFLNTLQGMVGVFGKKPVLKNYLTAYSSQMLHLGEDLSNFFQDVKGGLTAA